VVKLRPQGKKGAPRAYGRERAGPKKDRKLDFAKVVCTSRRRRKGGLFRRKRIESPQKESDVLTGGGKEDGTEEGLAALT